MSRTWTRKLIEAEGHKFAGKDKANSALRIRAAAAGATAAFDVYDDDDGDDDAATISQ